MSFFSLQKITGNSRNTVYLTGNRSTWQFWSFGEHNNEIIFGNEERWVSHPPLPPPNMRRSYYMYLWKTKSYLWENHILKQLLFSATCIVSSYVTLFGKSGLNENCVEPFFIAMHLETLKCIGEHSQCIWKHWQCSPTELRNVQYRFKIISKHSENVFERWKCIKWNIINSLQKLRTVRHLLAPSFDNLEPPS